MAAPNIQPLRPAVGRLSLAQRAPAVLHLDHGKPAVWLVMAGVTVVGVWVVVVVQVFGGFVINHASSSALRYSRRDIPPNRKPRELALRNRSGKSPSVVHFPASAHSPAPPDGIAPTPDCRSRLHLPCFQSSIQVFTE